MRASFLGAGFAVTLATASCGVSQPFACADDGQCFLGGTPGVCLPEGCAYPSEACTSGWAFAPGVPSVGGQCAEGPADSASAASSGASDSGTSGSTSTTSSDSTSSSGDATSRTTTSAVSISSGSTEGSTGDPLESTTGDSDSGSSGGTGCPPDESSSLQDPEPVELGPTCDAVVMGNLNGIGDADVFGMDFLPVCTDIEFLLITPDDSIEAVCVSVFNCGVDNAIECYDSELVIDGEVPSCCAMAPYGNDFEVALDIDAACGDFSMVMITVQGSSRGACTPYGIQIETG